MFVIGYDVINEAKRHHLNEHIPHRHFVNTLNVKKGEYTSY